MNTIIAPLCLERLSYLGLTNLNIVANKIGCSVDDLYAFLYEEGTLETDVLDKLSKLCNIEVKDVIEFTQREVSQREKKVVSDNNPGLDPEQKENVYDLLTFLDDVTKKPKR